MAFVFSTDKSYTEYHVKRNYTKRKERLTVSFQRSKREGANGYASISADLARKVCMGAKVIVGLDKEANELVIISSAVGNINVNKVSFGQYDLYAGMALGRFFLSQGVEKKDFPRGRYEASVDEEKNIHVNLNSVKEVESGE